MKWCTIRSELLAQYLIARSARENRAWAAAAFLAHSQTRSVSARSFVQDSGARDPGRAGIRDFIRSQLVEASCRRSSSHRCRGARGRRCRAVRVDSPVPTIR